MDEGGVGEMQNLCASKARSIKHEKVSQSHVADQELWFCVVLFKKKLLQFDKEKQISQTTHSVAHVGLVSESHPLFPYLSQG